MTGASTSVSRIIKAPRHAIYQAFINPDKLVSWLAPDTMTGKIHSFDPRVGGKFRMSLTYQNAEDSPGGKSSENTDTFEGTFVELIPDEKVVWVTEFESPQPEFSGEMRLTNTLTDTPEGTEVTIRCENIPPGIRPEDNELGTHQSLEKLAALFE